MVTSFWPEWSNNAFCAKNSLTCIPFLTGKVCLEVVDVGAEVTVQLIAADVDLLAIVSKLLRKGGSVATIVRMELSDREFCTRRFGRRCCLAL